MGLIRRINIGIDYKDSMSYSVGQSVYGNHEIIRIDEQDDYYEIIIKKDKDYKVWKSFNKNMGISVEYDLNYE